MVGFENAEYINVMAQLILFEDRHGASRASKITPSAASEDEKVDETERVLY